MLYFLRERERELISICLSLSLSFSLHLSRRRRKPAHIVASNPSERGRHVKADVSCQRLVRYVTGYFRSFSLSISCDQLTRDGVSVLAGFLARARVGLSSISRAIASRAFCVLDVDQSRWCSVQIIGSIVVIVCVVLICRSTK